MSYEFGIGLLAFCMIWFLLKAQESYASEPGEFAIPLKHFFTIFGVLLMPVFAFVSREFAANAAAPISSIVDTLNIVYISFVVFVVVVLFYYLIMLVRIIWSAWSAFIDIASGRKT